MSKYGGEVGRGGAQAGPQPRGPADSAPDRFTFDQYTNTHQQSAPIGLPLLVHTSCISSCQFIEVRQGI
jgi:hypothetical protein